MTPCKASRLSISWGIIMVSVPHAGHGMFLEPVHTLPERSDSSPVNSADDHRALCTSTNVDEQGYHDNVLRRPVSNRPTPTIAATTPTRRSQIVRSLGAPVKSSDKREPTEAEACIPKMISTTPTTSKAMPMTLCIPLSSLVLYQELAKKLADFSGLYPLRLY